LRLYLSSFDIGNRPDELVALAPQGRVGLVMNALDNRPQGRTAWRTRQADRLQELGFAVEELDLRDFFGSPETVGLRLDGLDMVWINGGNTFILRRAMRASGFDRAIVDRLRGDRIAYAGFSAATVILAPSLRGLEIVDDPADVPPGYPEPTDWEGLAILPFSVVVHWRSNHAESAAVEGEAAFYEREGIAYRTLRDGQALVVSGPIDTMRVVG
jgi:dipeptidase E